MYSPIDASRKIWRGFVKNPFQKVLLSIERVRYKSLWDRLLSPTEGNQFIETLLLNNNPFLVGRIGHTEGRIVGERKYRASQYGRLTLKEAHQYSGIFPVNEVSLNNFSDDYASALAEVDMLGFWQTSYQAKLMQECYPSTPVAPLQALEPYYHKDPWSAQLKHRRVLVVHPFASSILCQYYKKRSLIFANKDVLPEMELRALAPPQTLAPLTAGYSSWFDALKHLTDQVLQEDFDVALLGCGAYGLPLGAKIKSSGRMAIHLGGALQVLFGIRGRRWEHMPAVASLMNEHWVRPNKHETPASSSLVDGGCYW